MAHWTTSLLNPAKDPSETSEYDAKLEIAQKVSRRAEKGQVIGAGSGSTALIALQELARREAKETLDLIFIPTSYEIDWACWSFGLRVGSLTHYKPDWCFDGADEIDPQGNMIKGRGGAMYREKLVMSACDTRLILVDQTKFVGKLGEKFAVPVECDPNALTGIESGLVTLGGDKIEIRQAKGKDGPVITEKGNVILDVSFSSIDQNTEKDISAIPGVLESGLFWGYTPEILSL